MHHIPHSRELGIRHVVPSSVHLYQWWTILPYDIILVIFFFSFRDSVVWDVVSSMRVVLLVVVEMLGLWFCWYEEEKKDGGEVGYVLQWRIPGPCSCSLYY